MTAEIHPMPTEEDIANMPDRVGQVFVGKNILLTGATGFMGKVFLEKMLRVCPDIGAFYLLIRPKKGKETQERIRELGANPLFDKLKNLHGNDIMMKKCRAFSGDVSQLNLGLKPEDRKYLAENVDYIYHCAATVRFDEPLKHAVLLNTRGTKFMLDLAKECTKLQLFCHISTAYCNLNQKVLQERSYAPPSDPHRVIKTVEWMSTEMVESITEQLLGGMPNTYSYTKALSEALVVEQMDHLPIIMLRPSIVIPIWKEPIPGWTDNINGPTGLLIGAGKGVIRSMYCDPTRYADFIPVDIAANAIAVTSWDYLTNKGARRIYNLTSSHEIKVSWNEIIELGKKIVETKMPLNGVAWYPGGTMKANKYVHNLCVIFFHLLPAILVDTLLFCLGYKPVLWRVQQRILKGFEIFHYYANNQWEFENRNALLIDVLMNPRERLIYKIDRHGLDLEEYFTNCVHCARLYILKESDESLPAARRHMKVMWWVDKVTKILIMCFLFYMFIKVFRPILAAFV